MDNASDIRFIKGRLCFDDSGNSAPVKSVAMKFRFDRRECQ
jgi:hypothetical protein